MATTTKTQLSAPQSRAINYIRTQEIRTSHPSLGAVEQTQDVAREEIVRLAQGGLIEATLGDHGPAVAVADVRAGAEAWTVVRLTKRGQNVAVSPYNCVLRVLGHREVPLAAREVKGYADASDANLRQAQSDGLIQVVSPADIPLESLRRIPDELTLKITTKGRQYVDR